MSPGVRRRPTEGVRVRRPIVGGATSPFALYLRRYAVAMYPAAIGVPHPPASATADLARTARVVAVEFLDVGGRPVTGPAAYAFDHGLQVTPATVPEPATVALLAGRLLALAAARRRTRSSRDAAARGTG